MIDEMLRIEYPDGRVKKCDTLDIKRVLVDVTEPGEDRQQIRRTKFANVTIDGKVYGYVNSIEYIPDSYMTYKVGRPMPASAIIRDIRFQYPRGSPISAASGLSPTVRRTGSPIGRRPTIHLEGKYAECNFN